MIPGNSASEVVLRAGCKINLFLKVTGRREDGYHLLESLFVPLPTPSDTLRVTRVTGNGLRFSCSDTALDSAANIVIKAYDAFARITSYTPGLSVFLEKGIPYGAGLGGGSSDAAALLLFLNEAARKDNAVFLSTAELETLAAKLGADVPFFLHNRPSLVRGIGDSIEPAAFPLSGMHLVLVAPAIHVQTAWTFAAWDEKNQGKLGPLHLTNEEGEDTSPHVRGICVRNDLAPVVFERHPELRKIVAAFLDRNAMAASMSGSGSSIFGLFEEKSDAESAARFFLDAGERVFIHTL